MSPQPPLGLEDQLGQGSMHDQDESARELSCKQNLPANQHKGEIIMQ
jgi:hypothetical protein